MIDSIQSVDQAENSLTESSLLSQSACWIGRTAKNVVVCSKDFSFEQLQQIPTHIKAGRYWDCFKQTCSLFEYVPLEAIRVRIKLEAVSKSLDNIVLYFVLLKLFGRIVWGVSLGVDALARTAFRCYDQGLFEGVALSKKEWTNCGKQLLRGVVYTGLLFAIGDNSFLFLFVPNLLLFTYDVYMHQSSKRHKESNIIFRTFHDYAPHYYPRKAV